MLSETYQAHGHIPVDAYDISVPRVYPSDPFSQSLGASGTVGTLDVDRYTAYAWSSAYRSGAKFGVISEAYWVQPPYLPTDTAYAYAGITADFMFSGPDDYLSVSGTGYVSSTSTIMSYAARLIDLDSGQSARLPGSFSGYPGPLTETYSIAIDTTHVYRLELYLGGLAYKQAPYHNVQFLNVSHVAPVPLPGAALLGSIGLAYAGLKLRGRKES
jgi:hypothetical protein